MAWAVGSKWRCRYSAVASSGAPSASCRHCSRLRRQYSRSAPDSTNLSQLWQSRFHGQEPPWTTGWKVQNPPSAGVLRRDRSIARAWACSRESGAASPASSPPGLDVPGPATQTCCRTSSRSDWARCNGTVRYWNCRNSPAPRAMRIRQRPRLVDVLSSALVPVLVFLLALECVEQADCCGVAGPGVAPARDPADSGREQREAGVVGGFPSGPASLTPPGGTDQADARAGDHDVPGAGLAVLWCPDELVDAFSDDLVADRRQGLFPLAAGGPGLRGAGARCCGGRSGRGCWPAVSAGRRRLACPGSCRRVPRCGHVVPGLLLDGASRRRDVHSWWTGMASCQVGVAFLGGLPVAGAHRGGDLGPGRPAAAGGVDERELAVLEPGCQFPCCRDRGEGGHGVHGALDGRAAEGGQDGRGGGERACRGPVPGMVLAWPASTR